MYNLGFDSRSLPKRLPLQYIDDLCDDILHEEKSTSQRWRLSLHGGEPLLVGYRYFDELCALVARRLQGVDYSISVQSNATLITTEWAALFRKYGIQVGISLDGPTGADGKHRVTRAGNQSTLAALSGLRLLQNEDVTVVGAIAVVHHDVDGGVVVRFFRDEAKLSWFDLLLPDYHHDNLPQDWAEREVGYTAYLTDAFDEWLPSAHRIECRFFESCIKAQTGTISGVDTIGSPGATAIVLETSGFYEPHDVARTCLGFDRSTGAKPGIGGLEALRQSEAYQMIANVTGKLSDTCTRCRLQLCCGGGNILHRFSRLSGFANPSVHCSTLSAILDHARLRFLTELEMCKRAA